MGRIVSGVGRVVPKTTMEARDEATALLAASRAEADASRAEAAAAHAEAVRQGREQGRAEAAAELAGLLAAARAHAAALQNASTPAAIALALKMTEQIVGRAVTLAPELMADIVGSALEACRPRGDWVRVRVHPDDLAAVTAHRDGLAARAPTASMIDVVADPEVGRSGCVVETAVGRVDARLHTQLAALERALTEESHG